MNAESERIARLRTKVAMKYPAMLAGLALLAGCATAPPQPVTYMPDGRPYPQVVRCCPGFDFLLTGPIPGAYRHGYGHGYGHRGYAGGGGYGRGK